MPSNAATFGGLPTAGRTITLARDVVFDTALDCVGDGVLGDCKPEVQSEGPAACVCRSGSLTIQNMAVKGARALVLLVREDVTIKGVVDVSAFASAGGPGAEPDGGGTFAHGNASLVPLRAGRNGSGVPSAAGGAGGGAVQISAGRSLALEPNGRVQAGGGGGAASANEGSAGGSGGAILLEAPSLRLEGELLANGGGGAGGGDRSTHGASGQNARLSGRLSAAGGAPEDGRGCTLNGYTSGGRGGDGATQSTPAGIGQPGDSRSCIPVQYVERGGPGGGVGRIRINAEGPKSAVRSQSFFASPTATEGELTFAK